MMEIVDIDCSTMVHKMHPTAASCWQPMAWRHTFARS